MEDKVGKIWIHVSGQKTEGNIALRRNKISWSYDIKNLS
jgi:hypothetical protein